MTDPAFLHSLIKQLLVREGVKDEHAERISNALTLVLTPNE